VAKARAALLQHVQNIAVVSLQQGFGTVAMPQTQERDYADAKVEFYYEYGRWPTKAEAIEFDKTIPVKPLVKGEIQ
jgi:hypothetical protein